MSSMKVLQSLLDIHDTIATSIYKTLFFPQFYDQPEWYKSILEKINEAFTWIFTVEFAVKLFAFGCVSMLVLPFNSSRLICLL